MPLNVSDGLARQARERPYAVAVLARGQPVHFATLERAVRRAAAAFVARGVTPGQTVGLTFGRPLWHLVAALALARIGAVQVALAPTDPPAMRRATARELGVVLVAGDVADAGEAGLPVLHSDPAWLAKAGEVAAGPRHEGGCQPFMICHSSGTTGTRKTFTLSHADMLARWRRHPAATAVRAEDVFFSPARLDFATCKSALFWCLGQGATIVFDRCASSEELAGLLDRHQVTWSVITPNGLAGLARLAMGSRAIRFPHLRVLTVGGSIVPDGLRRAALERVSGNLLVSYGTNEAGIIAQVMGEDALRHPATVGRALDGVSWEIVDGQDRPVAPGTPGHLRVAGEGVVKGYADAATSTRAVRGGWLYPGDVLSADSEGRLTFHGRSDDMMIFDGINVFPAEVENVLLDHPSVREAAAFPLSEQAGDQMPMAAVVAHGPVGEAALLAHCRDRLGLRAPRRVMVLDAMPRNVDGKILKRELAARLTPGGSA
ncbi:class I adenylate-forming enzyme family protein [Marinimicrococcus flavescens]|uniref:Class I adenylate-forming enzyme family protein n=1 Tax=Marinimicrococcus flavescens TaxID=3031815 RepID=A0AAP3XRC2_9PROT|nr:class I adenylate-forming enzyme family protein [Marinimicrococcus flavescens]